MSEKAQGKISRETILTDSNEKKWIIGSFIGIDGSAENYEAAEYKGEIPDRYPELIKLKPHGDATLMSEINFFKQHANPKDIAKWISSKDHHYEYLGLPYYLGSAQNKTIDNTNMDFLVLERYGSDLETLLDKHNNVLPKPTVLKIGYHILAVLEYLHQREIVHGNIRAFNIRMDLHDERAIYLLPQFGAVDESNRNAMNFWSQYQHCGVRATTKRGDFESLLYNLIDWSGGILPWKNAPLEEIKSMKSEAFDNPKKFLEVAFPTCQCKESSACLAARKCGVSGKPVAAGLQAITDLMGQIASMDKTINCQPDYKAIEKMLRKRLLNMYHVPTSRLQFSGLTFISDEDIDEKSSRRDRKSFDKYIPGLRIAVDTLTHILAENCSSFDEVDALNNKYYGVIDVIDQMKKTNRIMYAVKPDLIREAWLLNTQELRTKVIQKWELKRIKTGSYKAWKKTKVREKAAKRTASDASTGNRKKAAVRNRLYALKRKRTGMIIHAYAGHHPLELKRKQDQQQKRCLKSCSSQSNKSNRRSKRFKPEHSVDKNLQDASWTSASESSEDDSEDTSSSSASESSEDDSDDTSPDSASESDGEDREDAHPTSASKSEDIQTPISSASSNRRSIEYDLEKNEAADESADLFPDETIRETTDEADMTGEQATERRRSESVDREPWFDTYEWLNVWLELREYTSRVVGSVSSEPEVKAHQTLQVRVLRDEFNLQLHQLRRLMNVLTELPSDSEDVQKLNQIQQRWLSQLIWLEESANKLNAESLSQLRDVLQDQDIVVWLIKEFGMTSEKLLISTDRESLRQQREHYQTVYQRIINKETEVKMLLNDGRSALVRSQHHKNATVQHLFLDVIESQWKALKKNSFKNHERLEICVEYSEKYCQAKNVFLRWLIEAKQKLECYKPSSLNDIEKVLQELSSLSNEAHEKSGDIKQCINLGRIFIGAVDEDKDDVMTNELISMNNRWDKLYSNLLERRDALKDMNKLFAVFGKSLLEMNDKLQVCNNELASYYNLEGAAKYLKIHHHIIELLNKIASAREKVIDLVPKARQQGIDASYLMDELNRVADGIESLKTKQLDTCEKILEQQLVGIVKELQQKKKDECDNDTDRLQKVSELKAVLSKINTLSGNVENMVASVESVLGSVTDTANHA